MADPAHDVINAATAALRTVFTPTSEFPPMGGGTNTVRFVAGDTAPDAAVMLHFFASRDQKCDEPLVWVRLARRYRTQKFPVPYIGDNPCGAPRAIAVELGIARCAPSMKAEPKWSDFETEAEYSLDDSHRIETAACRLDAVVRQGTGDGHPLGDAVATDGVVPFGPATNVIGWVTTVYVQI